MDVAARTGPNIRLGRRCAFHHLGRLLRHLPRARRVGILVSSRVGQLSRQVGGNSGDSRGARVGVGWGRDWSPGTSASVRCGIGCANLDRDTCEYLHVHTWRPVSCRARSADRWARDSRGVPVCFVGVFLHACYFNEIVKTRSIPVLLGVSFCGHPRFVVRRCVFDHVTFTYPE